MADQPRRLALVVGGTGKGIGAGIARSLLARGGTDVVLIGRNEERGAATVERLKQAAEQSGHAASVEFASVDCYSLANVKAFCAEFSAARRKLDILVLASGRSARAVPGCAQQGVGLVPQRGTRSEVSRASSTPLAWHCGRAAVA